MEKTDIIGFAIVLVVFLVAFLIFFILYQYERARERQSTATAMGRVISYDYGRGGVPLVEYLVDGKVYTRILEYSMITTISAPFHSVKATSPTDPLAKRITIYRNSHISFNGLMEEHFPLGKSLRVYYNPQKPKQSYVERYAGIKRFFAAPAFLMGLAFVTLLVALLLIQVFQLPEGWVFTGVFLVLFSSLLIYFYLIFFRD